MYEPKIEDDLDYEFMYANLPKRYRISEIQEAVLASSGATEICINITIKNVTTNVNPDILGRHAGRRYIPMSTKLDALNKGKIISTKLHQNMQILFNIRNSFAHKVIFSAQECEKIFEQLSGATMPNSFVENLPNNIIKYQLLSSCCQVTLSKISEIIDPDSIMHLEATEETKFEEIDEEMDVK